MRDFRAIIKILKEYASHESKKKVYDKDVAELLKISQTQFATLKRRNSTPYVQILEFCNTYEVSCKDIFFG